MNEIKFGYGLVSICPCTWNDMPVLLLEEGRGSGEIGGPVPSRVKGLTLYPEALDEEAHALSFKNVESLDVLIENLEFLRTQFTKGDS